VHDVITRFFVFLSWFALVAITFLFVYVSSDVLSFGIYLEDYIELP
jgi:hypothetical protein